MTKVSGVTHERFVVRSREGEKLRSDIRYVKDGKPKPVILFLHGFKGFKDWGPFPTLLEELAHAGFVTIAFNFSHNGIGEDLQNFTELDRFAQNTFSRELDEVIDMIAEIEGRKQLPIDPVEIQAHNIGLLGHSRGAAMALLAARWAKQVRCVAALAPVSTFERYSDRQKEKWRREGYFEVLNVRTKQVMRLGIGLLDDLERHRERLDIMNAASHLPSLEKPCLIICGENDLIAKASESQALAKAAEGPLTQIQIILHTGHTLGAEHPFTEVTEPLRQAVSLATGFFRKYLGEHPVPILR